jgi:acetyl esterase/lipase
MVGISVEYRLFNKNAGTTVFDCVKDARSAARYVRAHAAELGIDPQKLVVNGGSAGGHLAAGTALFDGVDEAGEDPAVSCVPNALVLFFPVIDTSTEGYGNAKIGARWQELSPVHRVKPGVPPTIIFHGTGDTVTPFKGAQAFHDAMVKAGNRCELVVKEGAAHGYLMREREVFEEALHKTEAFLTSLGFLKATGK